MFICAKQVTFIFKFSLGSTMIKSQCSSSQLLNRSRFFQFSMFLPKTLIASPIPNEVVEPTDPPKPKKPAKPSHPSKPVEAVEPTVPPETLFIGKKLFNYSTSSGEASSDELVMQNSLRMRKYDPACAMQSCSSSMSNQPTFLCYINASIYDYYLLLRCSMELKLPLPRQISSQCRILS